MLNKEKKREKQEEGMRLLKICESCGKEMIDNSFQRGSRKAGSYNCSCGTTIIF